MDKNFFSNEIGFDADLKRHRVTETRIREQIEEMKVSDNEFADIYLEAFGDILTKLLESKKNLITMRFGKIVLDELVDKTR